MSGMNTLDAINAYNKAGNLAGKVYGEESENKGSFTNLVEQALSSTGGALAKAEQATLGNAAGEVSLEDLAIAVANAEVSLKSLVAIRDKLVNAYQDIIKMPI